MRCVILFKEDYLVIFQVRVCSVSMVNAAVRFVAEFIQTDLIPDDVV